MSVAELIPEYLQAVAIVLAGLWAYWRFFYQQNHEPATDIYIDVERIGLQAGCQILEVTATLENKSLVKHKYEDFRMTMRYLLAEDQVKDGGAEHNYQLYFPHSIDERIGRRRYFANVAYINPRQRFHHRYETFVPVDATAVWVHCKFAFRKRGAFRGWRETHGDEDLIYVDAQKVVLLAEGEPN
jgi:hypothetical protein